MSHFRNGHIGKNTKYSTGNFISRRLISDYFKNLASILRKCEFCSVLEVGCGEGILLRELQSEFFGKQVVAIDIDENEVVNARRNASFAQIDVADAYGLPFETGEFDLVLCCEVLEHLGEPDRALSEIQRVSGSHAVLSVPREPIWRVLNMCRGAYVSHLGNTPGHINHWSSSSFGKLISSFFEVSVVRCPLPWTMVAGRHRICPS